MRFRLIHKKLGVKSINVFSEFESPSNIRDIYFVKDLGFFCLCENALMLIAPKECRQIISLDNPMSICNGEPDSFYVLYNGGIKNINYKDKYYSTDMLSASVYDIIFGQLSNIGIYGMSMDSYSNTLGICISSMHKFYKLKKMSIEKEFGTGISEYGLSSDLTRCSLYSPQDILVYNTDTIFVADTLNGCIRSFNKTHRIITGNPLNSTIAPTKLLIDRKKDLLYYLSKNYLRSVFVDGSNDATLYESEYIRSMVLTDDGKIYILEALEGNYE